jgi:hypothetical protein
MTLSQVDQHHAAVKEDESRGPLGGRVGPRRSPKQSTKPCLWTLVSLDNELLIVVLQSLSLPYSQAPGRRQELAFEGTLQKVKSWHSTWDNAKKTHTLGMSNDPAL